jgi:7-carboxy-7-deazaguanine synthase
VTRNEAAWVNHRKFLARCIEHEVEVFAKAIVSAETAESDLVEACRVLVDVAPDTPLILQPMTPFREARNAPTAVQLLEWQALCLRHLRDVRVVPQAHKMMGQL